MRFTVQYYTLIFKLNGAGLVWWFHCSEFAWPNMPNGQNCERRNKRSQPNPVLLSMLICPHLTHVHRPGNSVTDWINQLVSCLVRVASVADLVGVVSIYHYHLQRRRFFTDRDWRKGRREMRDDHAENPPMDGRSDAAMTRWRNRRRGVFYANRKWLATTNPSFQHTHTHTHTLSLSLSRDILGIVNT